MASGPSDTPTLPSTPPKCTQTSSASSANTPGVDSGYATATSNSPNPYDTRSQPCHLTGRMIPGTARYGNLQQFERPVSSETIERYTAISMQLQPALIGYMNKHYRTHAPIVMRLMVYGHAVDEARPGVVVFCHPEREKRIRRFFCKQFARDLCKPKGEAVHSFQIIVLPLPVNLLGSEEVSLLTNDRHITKTLSGAPIFLSHVPSLRGTLGGLLTITSDDGDYHICGLTASHIAFPSAQAESELASDDDMSSSDDSVDDEALNATSPFVSDDENSVYSADEEALSTADRAIGDNGGSVFSNEEAATSVTELSPPLSKRRAGWVTKGAGIQEHGSSATAETHPRAEHSSDTHRSEDSSDLQAAAGNYPPQYSDDGQHVLLGVAGVPELSRSGFSRHDMHSSTLDWALTSIHTKEISMKPNRLRCAPSLRLPDTDLVAAPASISSSTDCRRVIINVTREEQQEGSLSSLPTSIWLDRSGGFVQVFTLEMLTGSGMYLIAACIYGERQILPTGLQRGDSGAWVVEPISLRVHGHLVAADVLGDGYVVPLRATLDDIRRVTQAKAVDLTTGVDIVIKEARLAVLEAFGPPAKPKVAKNTTHDLKPSSANDTKPPRRYSFVDSGYSSRLNSRLNSPQQNCPSRAGAS